MPRPNKSAAAARKRRALSGAYTFTSERIYGHTIDDTVDSDEEGLDVYDSMDLDMGIEDFHDNALQNSKFLKWNDTAEKNLY